MPLRIQIEDMRSGRLQIDGRFILTIVLEISAKPEKDHYVLIILLGTQAELMECKRTLLPTKGR